MRLKHVSTTQLEIARLAPKVAALLNAQKLAKLVTQCLILKIFTLVHNFTFYFVASLYHLLCFLSGASSYSVKKHERDIQLEIMNNGPVEGALTVYEDFPVYKSGKF